MPEHLKDVQQLVSYVQNLGIPVNYMTSSKMVERVREINVERTFEKTSEASSSKRAFDHTFMPLQPDVTQPSPY